MEDIQTGRNGQVVHPPVPTESKPDIDFATTPLNALCTGDYFNFEKCYSEHECDPSMYLCDKKVVQFHSTATDTCHSAFMIYNSVNGGFSAWTPWIKCSDTCGDGTRSRYRLCNNPPPQYGGAECNGDLSSFDACSIQKICPINGFFSNWSTWTTCSVSCGNGTRVRERLCDNPQPQHNGSTCTGDYKESEDCFTGILCPKILCYHCNSTSHKFCDQGNFDSDKYSYDKIYISDGELCVKCTKGYKGGVYHRGCTSSKDEEGCITDFCNANQGTCLDTSAFFLLIKLYI
ncbi:HMCN1-like protein [Mya arenaria]|uniref:HMCN1-like protein n=1 Tax=Mya arenaria TaxID=6604 RepID=A0ABY7EEQ8_MYAAR|nr:HMCN1-like protein [Mya arenaria]